FRRWIVQPVGSGAALIRTAEPTLKDRPKSETMNTLPRRHFLGTAAAAAAFATLRSHAEEASPPAIKLGLIGCGWWGLIDAKAALKAGGVEIAAVCDVASAHLAKAAEEIGKIQGGRPK